MDRKKIIREFEHEVKKTHDEEWDFVYLNPDFADKLLMLLKEQEVKTGRWIDSAGNDKCSICGEEYSDLYPDYGNTHFCPNCGAKMEGR